MDAFVMIMFFIGVILIIDGTNAIGKFFQTYKVMLSDVYFIFMSVILLGFIFVGFSHGYMMYKLLF